LDVKICDNAAADDAEESMRRSFEFPMGRMSRELQLEANLPISRLIVHGET
jgi:hypothetical protein